MIVANGSHIVTTFFVISALMLVLSLVTKLEQTGRKIGFLEIIMISIARYVRYAKLVNLCLPFSPRGDTVFLGTFSATNNIFPRKRFLCTNSLTLASFFVIYESVLRPCMLS